MRAGGSNRDFVELFVLILLQPHELRALWTGSHLRCHGFPFTLGPPSDELSLEPNLVQDASRPQDSCHLL